MNPIVKRELEKVRAKLPEYDDSTTLIWILRDTTAPSSTLKEGGIYLIEVADYVLNEPPNFTLAANWNKGIVPVSKQLSIQVVKIAGKMVQINGDGFDEQSRTLKPDKYKEFWLPMASIKILDEYKW